MEVYKSHMSQDEKQSQIDSVITQHEQSLKLALTVLDKLGNLSKGQDVELDNRLTQLRKSHAKGGDLVGLTEKLNDAHSSAKHLEDVVEVKQKQMRDFLLSAGEALQSIKGMEDNTRRQLRMVVNKLKTKDALLFNEIEPVLAKLLEAYQQTLHSLTNVDQEKSNPSDSKIESHLLKKVISRLIKLSNSAIIKPRTTDFKGRIQNAKHDLDQMDICLTYFEETVNQFSEEFLQTQKLILNINSALAEVHKTLIQSITNSKDYNLQLDQLNSKIDIQINELSKDADDANNIIQLKSVIEDKLTIINESIKTRDELELKRAQELDSVLQEMENKLADLEKRTEYYRNKWLKEIARADMDALTSLPNRGAYDKRFNEEFKRWLRNPDPLCVAVIDVDHFKKINDLYGHSVGDKTLQIVAKTLRQSLRETDFLARYGGEEFVCLMLNTDAKEMMVPLEKLRKAISSIPFKVKNDRLNITVSVGVTMLLATDNVHTAFDRADKALYEAKHSGRNRICYKK